MVLAIRVRFLAAFSGGNSTEMKIFNKFLLLHANLLPLSVITDRFTVFKDTGIFNVI
jgi:hypothetical protein